MLFKRILDYEFVQFRKRPTSLQSKFHYQQYTFDFCHPTKHLEFYPKFLPSNFWPHLNVLHLPLCPSSMVTPTLTRNTLYNVIGCSCVAILNIHRYGLVFYYHRDTNDLEHSHFLLPNIEKLQPIRLI